MGNRAERKHKYDMKDLEEHEVDLQEKTEAARLVLDSFARLHLQREQLYIEIDQNDVLAENDHSLTKSYYKKLHKNFSSDEEMLEVMVEWSEATKKDLKAIFGDLHLKKKHDKEVYHDYIFLKDLAEKLDDFMKYYKGKIHTYSRHRYDLEEIIVAINETHKKEKEKFIALVEEFKEKEVERLREEVTFVGQTLKSWVPIVWKKNQKFPKLKELAVKSVLAAFAIKGAFWMMHQEYLDQLPKEQLENIDKESFGHVVLTFLALGAVINLSLSIHKTFKTFNDFEQHENVQEHLKHVVEVLNNRKRDWQNEGKKKRKKNKS